MQHLGNPSQDIEHQKPDTGDLKHTIIIAIDRAALWRF
jgi:hypothetical protein